MHKLRETFEDEESSEVDESGGDNSDSNSNPQSDECQSRSKKTKINLHHKDSQTQTQTRVMRIVMNRMMTLTVPMIVMLDIRRGTRENLRYIHMSSIYEDLVTGSV